jgi:hypothetical protein
MFYCPGRSVRSFAFDGDNRRAHAAAAAAINRDLVARIPLVDLPG